MAPKIPLTVKERVLESMENVRKESKKKGVRLTMKVPSVKGKASTENKYVPDIYHEAKWLTSEDEHMVNLISEYEATGKIGHQSL